MKSVQLIWAVFTPIPGISYWHLLECVDLNIEVLAVDCIIRRIAQRCIDFLNSIHINGLFQSDGYIYDILLGKIKNKKVQKSKFSRNKKFKNKKLQKNKKCSSIKKLKKLQNLKKFKNQINLKINTWKIGYLVKNVAQNL